MRKIRLLIIPDGAKRTKSILFPHFLIRGSLITLFLLFSGLGFLTLDYWHLSNIRKNHYELIAENQHLKGEAQILMSNLEEVRQSLQRIQDYTSKLDELVNLNFSKVSKRVGIGPLTPEEYSTSQRNTTSKDDFSSSIPLGINIDRLIFRPVMGSLEDIHSRSKRQAIELQRLLSTLGQRKSILSAIPSLKPVDGWIASGFGSRISPFTGVKTVHRGLDIAAPVGTPILAPAAGVAIFSGAKDGFGNFIMIAHYGYGIVTRYGHNAQNMVRVGQRVKRGEQIATVGMTGRTTGPHLHYEVWVDGQAVNPRKFILD